MEVLIVTGMSGAGKSRAINALEDVGFYCVDNLPPKLLPKFAELCLQSQEKINRIAIVVDVRGGMWFDYLSESLEELRVICGEYRILYLDCDTQVLKRRYKETRRQHPIAVDTGCSISEAIDRERKLLQPLLLRRDYLIDTSFLSPAQLKESIVNLFLDNPDAGMTITCMSFGFKYGYPEEADLVLDVRCFDNPFYVDELKHKTGMDKEVRDYVHADKHMPEFLNRLYSLIDYMLPLYRDEGKSQLVIAVGCTGGKHRSVTVAEDLVEHFRQKGLRVNSRHRDIRKI
ncbi:MAG: RNase adapter RapZ [Acutalibacteraceae bacterium]|jgi:UPF0042 nucleotide-binding protein